MVRRSCLYITLLLLSCNAIAQPLDLKIREAFNWQTGDTLVYRTVRGVTIVDIYGGNHYVTYFGGHISFVVLAKDSFQDSIRYVINYPTDTLINDTIVIINPDSSIKYFKWPTGFTLNSSCQDLTSVPICDSNTACFLTYGVDSSFGGRRYVENHIGLFESLFDMDFIEDAGLKSAWYSALEFDFGKPGGCGVLLAAYKSSSTTWIDTPNFFVNVGELVGSTLPNLILYPNPVSNTLFISPLYHSNSPITGIHVYDMQLRLMLVLDESVTDNLSKIDVSNFEPGIYLLQVTYRDDRKEYFRKFLKE